MKKLSKLLVTALFCLSVAFAAVVPAFAATARVKNVKASVTASKVILSWNKASGVSGYQVQQYVKEKWQAVGTTAKTTYTVKKLTTGKTYRFRVRAYKKSGKKTVYGKASAAVSAKPSCIAPTNFKASVLSPSSAKFTWKAVPAANGYKLQKYDGKKWVDVSKTTKTSLTVSKLSTGVAVKYRVLAFKTVGKKAVNGRASAVLTVTPTIKVPGSVKAVAASPVSATISWSAVPGVSGYLIYKYDETGKKWAYAAMTGRTSLTVSKLIPTVENRLKVRAYVKSGSKTVYGAFSKEVAFKTTAIAAPTALTLKASDSTTATLSWNAVSGVTGYAVYLWNSTENKWQWSLTCTGNGCTVKNLPSNSDFTVAVKAYIKAENGKNYLSANSNSVSGHTSPAAVTDLKALNLTDKSFTLSWTASKDADIIERYEIYAQITRTNEDGDRVSSFEYIGSVPKDSNTFNVESLDDKPLEQKTPYIFRILGYSFYTKTNSAGKPVTNRLYTTAAEAVITTALTDVKDFRAENPTSSSINLSWSENVKAESYKLQIKKDGAAEWTDIDLSKCDKVDKGTAVRSYTVKDLEPSTAYFFRVTAVSGNVTSVGNNEIPARTAPKSDAVLEKEAVKPTSISIKWNAVSGADGYEIQWIKPGSESWEVLKETEETKLTVNNLEQCSTYKFKMRSYYTAADGSKVYAEQFSNELSETTLLNPISLAYRADYGMTGSNAISVAWIANSKATSYELFYKESSAKDWKKVDASITNKNSLTENNVCVYKLEGLEPATEYSFKGVAVWGDVKSNESDVTKGMTAPAAVSGFKASEIKDNSAVLKWNTSAKVSKYVVEINVDGNWVVPTASGAEGYLSVLSSGVCKVKNLKPAKEYSFRIYAVGKFDSTRAPRSEYSNALSVVTKLETPSGVSAAKDTSNTKHILVSWTGVEKAEHYNIYRSDKETAIGTVTTTSFKDTTAAPGIYTYRVEAVKGDITSEKSAQSDTVRIDIDTVTNVVATVKSHSEIELTWTPVEGANYYMVSCNKGTPVKATTNSCTFNNLTGHKEYSFEVQAFANSEVYSAKAASPKVTTPVAPIENLDIKRADNEITLTWTAGNNKGGGNDIRYFVYVGDSDTPIKSVVGNFSCSFTLSDAEAKTVSVATYIGGAISTRVSKDIPALVSQEKAA